MRDVRTEAEDAGHVYTGTVGNRLDVAVTAPSVDVFPVNRVGRPLGLAADAGTADLAPGADWSFRTSPVSDLGSGYAAYPFASIVE